MAHRFRFAIVTALVLLCTTAFAQDLRAPNMFKDLDPNHWAYAAVDGLRSRNIVAGYPETYFRSHRALTRYEFAVAIDRALKTASSRSADSLTAASETAPTAADVEALRRLTREFHDELASLGTDDRAVSRMLERLSRGSSPGDIGALSADIGVSTAVGPDKKAGPSLSGSANGLPARRDLRSAPFSLNLAPGGGRGPILTLGALNRSADSLAHPPKPDGGTATGPLTAPDTLSGVRLAARTGPLTLRAFYGSRNVAGTDDAAWTSVLLAAATQPQGFALPGAFLTPGTFPNGIGRPAGVESGLGFRLSSGSGSVGLSALSVTNSPAGTGGPDDITLLSANSDVRLAGRITLSAEWARSMAGISRLSPSNPTDSDSFNASVGFNSAGLNISAGYRYVDPLFYTPSYMGRIGNWLNPTNIQGPSFRASYDVTPSLGFTVGGDFFTAARDNSPVGLDANEDIKRALLGVRWGLSRTLDLTADYEGVFWSLNGSRGAGTGMFHPTEHYVTLGTGFNITGNTLLRLNYQIGDLDGHGALNYGSSTRSRFNAFVGQVNVKF